MSAFAEVRFRLNWYQPSQENIHVPAFGRAGGEGSRSSEILLFWERAPLRRHAADEDLHVVAEPRVGGPCLDLDAARDVPAPKKALTNI